MGRAFLCVPLIAFMACQAFAADADCIENWRLENRCLTLLADGMSIGRAHVSIAEAISMREYAEQNRHIQEPFINAIKGILAAKKNIELVEDGKTAEEKYEIRRVVEAIESTVSLLTKISSKYAGRQSKIPSPTVNVACGETSGKSSPSKVDVSVAIVEERIIERASLVFSMDAKDVERWVKDVDVIVEALDGADPEAFMGEAIAKYLPNDLILCEYVENIGTPSKILIDTLPPESIKSTEPAN